MPPDPRKYLWDALRAAELVRDFAQGQSFADYQSNALSSRCFVITARITESRATLKQARRNAAPDQDRRAT